MATITTNLTNLSNARKDIINKLNNTLGSSIPQTTPLSNISPYINTANNYMVDFMNMKKSYPKLVGVKLIANVNSQDMTDINSMNYCNIDQDGFLIISAWIQYYSGNWGRLLFCNDTKNKITQSLINDSTRFTETLNKWIVVDHEVTHDSWKGCTLHFAGWVKEGQQVAVTCSRPYKVFNTHAVLLNY